MKKENIFYTKSTTKDFLDRIDMECHLITNPQDFIESFNADEGKVRKCFPYHYPCILINTVKRLPDIGEREEYEVVYIPPDIKNSVDYFNGLKAGLMT